VRSGRRENQVYLHGNSALFFLLIAGGLPVALDTKRPRRRIAGGKTSHQVTVNLILAYLINIRSTNIRFKPVFVLRHILRRNAITLLLLE
jgi:hypothetical protein